MELWRTNSDYAVLLTLESLRKQKIKGYSIDNRFEVRLEKETKDILIENLKLNLSIEEILNNVRALARYITNKNHDLKFNLIPIRVYRNDTVKIKEMILTKSYRELGINTQTLWEMKKRLKQNGSIKLYNKSKQYFVSE